MIYKYRGIFRLHDHSFNLWGSPFKVEIPGRSTPRLTADPPFADCVGAACCLVSSGLAHLQLTTLVSKSPKTSVTGILKHFGYASGWEKSPQDPMQRDQVIRFCTLGAAAFSAVKLNCRAGLKKSKLPKTP